MTILKLTDDLKEAAKGMSLDEARFLVDTYYQMQGDRIRSNNQMVAINDQSPLVLEWVLNYSENVEKQIKRALDLFSAGHRVGEWSRSIRGIGPVLAAGLLAHIDIEKAPTVGHIWSFAGLNPAAEWKKKTKRPHNAKLKTLCWKIGESFVKAGGVYGDVYRDRKDLEIERNEAGEFADQAAAKLEKFKIGKTTEAYKWYSNGKLPPAHIHARAKRYAVKLFLSHWHHVAYFHHYGKAPPKPYILDNGHVHMIEPPNFNEWKKAA